ncbi:MAG: hypothetical protein J1F40_05835 [Prevotellaceae bacterium]|nr:hypothetical protein [Prevotellaceae bacterium]
MRKHIKRAGFLAVMLSAILLSGCNTQKKEKSGLQGAWALQKITPPDDSTHEYHVALYRIYDEDGMLYEYQLLPSEEAGDVLISGDMKSYTCIDKGGGDFLYLEGNKQCMLEMPNDTTMVTQQFGMLYTWTHANTLSDSRLEEIKQIVSKDQVSAGSGTERHILPQEETNHTHIYIIIIIAVVLIVSYVLVTKKLKRRVQQKMRQLDEERTRLKEESEERLLPIGKTELSEAEKEFMQSVYYISLQHRLTTGRRMKDAEWKEMEVRLNEVYPNFAGTLRGLCKMSETEWQVCMLIKLRVAPTEIAKVMNKDISSISSIRKRLFQKLFDKKGKPKELDDYILSL